MEQQKNKDNRNQIPRITIPQLQANKSHTAIKGLGETFESNPQSGSGDFSIPITVPDCRGFEPQLALEYSSGQGNGSFGLGFNLTIPFIARRTDKGIPRYQADDEFLLNNQVLVVKLILSNGKWLPDSFEQTVGPVTYQVQRYQLRIESNFSRIEFWQADNPELSYWKVVDKTNIIYLFGQSSQATIADPASSGHIFKWLLSQTYDAKGNQIYYDYKPEDIVNVPAVEYEQNRAQTANRYIHKIRYGDSVMVGNQSVNRFQIVFDYGPTLRFVP